MPSDLVLSRLRGAECGWETVVVGCQLGFQLGFRLRYLRMIDMTAIPPQAMPQNRSGTRWRFPTVSDVLR